MNRALAETLSFLNVLIAIIIVLAGAALGYRLGGSILATISGGFVGFVVAALSCGAVAYLALIERHLAQIAGGRSGDNRAAIRRDPML